MEMTPSMKLILGMAILDLEMPENDAVASTIRGYLVKLLRAVWIDGEGFDERPFGNSGWENEVYAVLVKAELTNGDSEGYPYSPEEAEQLILMAIDAL